MQLCIRLEHKWTYRNLFHTYHTLYYKQWIFIIVSTGLTTVIIKQHVKWLICLCSLWNVLSKVAHASKTCYNPGNLLPSSYHDSLDSTLGYFMWNLWHTMWSGGQDFCRYLCVPVYSHSVGYSIFWQFFLTCTMVISILVVFSSNFGQNICFLKALHGFVFSPTGKIQVITSN